MNNESIQYAGQIIIDEIYLYRADKQEKLDISFLFVEIDLFEDIYSPSMCGTITMVEDFNLIGNWPIIGEEMIRLVCHTPTSTVSIIKNFAVVGVTDRIIDSAKKHVYVLNLITAEAIVDLNTKVFKAYSGLPSDAVKSIFSEYFPGVGLGIEAATVPIKVVAPTISPFSMINLLATKSFDNTIYGAPNFLFYESSQQYNFVSLTTLFEQDSLRTWRWSKDQLRYNYMNDGSSGRDVEAEYENAKDVTIEKLFSSIDKSMSGAMGHTVTEVDVIRKSIKRISYNYMDNFDDLSHLNYYPVDSKNITLNNEAVMETSVINPAYNDSFRTDLDSEILLKRPAILSQNEFIKMTIVAHGKTDLAAGQMVIFEMGNFETGDASSVFNDPAKDSYYTGYYLISAIRHRITLTRHEVEVELINESFQDQITFPDPNKS